MKLNNLKNMFAHSHSTQLNHHISLSRERVELFHIVFIRFIQSEYAMRSTTW